MGPFLQKLFLVNFFTFNNLFVQSKVARDRENKKDFMRNIRGFYLAFNNNYMIVEEEFINL